MVGSALSPQKCESRARAAPRAHERGIWAGTGSNERCTERAEDLRGEGVIVDGGPDHYARLEGVKMFILLMRHAGRGR